MPRFIKEKGCDIKYQNLKTQDYFLSVSMNVKQCNLLFSLRARMTPVKCNFPKSFVDYTCPVCRDINNKDTQLHLIHCKSLINDENMLVKNQVIYEDLLSCNTGKQVIITQLYENLFKKRRKIELEKIVN